MTFENVSVYFFYQMVLVSIRDFFENNFLCGKWSQEVWEPWYVNTVVHFKSIFYWVEFDACKNGFGTK